MAAGLDAVAAGLAADQRDVEVVEERVEQPHRVGAAADAGDDGVGQPADEVEHLLARLDADDALEVADHHRERVRPDDRADDVVGRLDVGDPVAHRLVGGVLERAGAARHRDDLGAEQAHAGDVERLPAGVLLAHVDGAVEAEQRAGGRRRDAVLAGAGLGDDALLAHLLGEQRLAEHVVDLVAAGVGEVLALEQDARAAGVLGQPAGVGERRRAAGVRREQPVELGEERRVGAGGGVGGGELVERGDERLGDEAAAVRAEVAGGVGADEARQVRCVGHESWPRAEGWLPAVTSSATAARGSPPVTTPSPTRTASAPQAA